MTYERTSSAPQVKPGANPSRLVLGVVATAVVFGALQFTVVEAARDVKRFLLKRRNKPKRF